MALKNLYLFGHPRATMLQPIRIRFRALSCFETNIYQRVVLRGPTHANKAVTDRQTKFVNKHFITDLSVCLIKPRNACKWRLSSHKNPQRMSIKIILN